MKKESEKSSLVNDFRSMLGSFSKKKKGIKDLEELKMRFTSKINFHLDKLYWKKNSVQEVKVRKKEFKKSRLGVLAKILKTNFWTTIKFFVSMPFIYVMIIPGLIIHVSVEIYHQICFRLYGIPLVNPREYFVFDRAHLPQLNWLEKFNCFYCSYYNCLISYLQEIVARTERFWCPIKHSKRIENVHKHYGFFVDYSDAKSLRKDWKELRKFEGYKK